MLQDPTKHKWIKYVKTLLCSSGFSGAWEQQLVNEERKFIKHLSSDVETCIHKTVLMILKAVHVAGCIKKVNKYISLKPI